MRNIAEEDFSGRLEQKNKSTFVEQHSALKRQYLRAREYCGYSLDELINKPQARKLLREVWLLGCMVRKPEKLNTLPDNPFATTRTLYLRK